MKIINKILCGVVLIFAVQSIANAAPLINAQEAALPSAPEEFKTRGISRGPVIKLNSPKIETPVLSPFDFKLTFEARGDAKIDTNSIKIIYMKEPLVDLTPRLKSAISPDGVYSVQTEAPPGNHAIKVTVKDTDGRETNAVFNLVVTK